MSDCPYCGEEIKDAALKCPHCREWLNKDQQSELGTTERFLELQQMRLAEDVRESVESSLRRKYSWLGVIAIFLTGGGITLLVNGLLTDATKNIAVAEALMERSMTTINKIDDSLKQLVDLESQLEEMERKADEVDKTIEGALDLARVESRQSITDLTKQMKIIEERVGELLRIAATTDQATEFESTVEALRKNADSQRERFISNSNYTVEFAFGGKGDSRTYAIMNELKDRGFKTRRYPTLSPAGVAQAYDVEESHLQETDVAYVFHYPVDKDKAEELAQFLASIQEVRETRLVEKNKTNDGVLGIFLK